MFGLDVVSSQETPSVSSETCEYHQDDVCFPKCSPTCTSEQDNCKDNCTDEVRNALRANDKTCLRVCMIDCFLTNKIEPQCQNKAEPSEADKLKAEEEARKAKEASEKEKKRREEEEARRKKERELANQCGSCYGAEDHSPSRNGCCKTCSDVRRAYEVSFPHINLALEYL
jgi:hypothetical protein